MSVVIVWCAISVYEAVQIQPKKYVLDHSDNLFPTRQDGLYIGHADRIDQGSVFPVWHRSQIRILCRYKVDLCGTCV